MTWSKQSMGKNNHKEFGISAVKLEGNKTTIEGRCHRGSIESGGSFTAISELIVQTTAQTVGPTSLRHLASVNMGVDSIWAYGQQLKELNQTMTARLELSGSGFEQLKVGLVLS